MANIAVINLLPALTAFAAATNAVVNDDTSDGIPEMFGIDLLESTTMDSSNAVGGHKNLLIFDANSYLICDRIGTTVVYEPLVPGTGGINPAGIVGGSPTGGSAPTPRRRPRSASTTTPRPMATRPSTPGGPSPAGTSAAGVVCPGCSKPLEDTSRNVHEGCPEDRRLWVSVPAPS